MTRLLMCVAGILIAISIVHVIGRQKPPSATPEVHAEPFSSPFECSVCGPGIVEPEGDVLKLAAPVAGIVAEVLVKPGDTVTVGDPLLRLDDRHLLAERGRRSAALERSRAELARLRQPVRCELLAVKEAAIVTAQIDVNRAEQVLQRIADLRNKNAAGEEEYLEAMHKRDSMTARLAMAAGDFDLLKAGTWQFDLDVAQAAVRESESSLAQIDTEMDRLILRAPIDGEVLQVNNQPGEAVGQPGNPEPIVLAKRDSICVRVDIDEYDLDRFDPDAPAVGVLKGATGSPFLLEFLWVEPLVIAKRSLSGGSVERVDTRVLQVVYRVVPTKARLYYGQQVYVCTEARSH